MPGTVKVLPSSLRVGVVTAVLFLDVLSSTVGLSVEAVLASGVTTSGSCGTITFSGPGCFLPDSFSFLSNSITLSIALSNSEILSEVCALKISALPLASALFWACTNLAFSIKSRARSCLFLGEIPASST